MSTSSMTTGEADAYRAGQATIRERHMLALTHLRTALERRDLRAAQRAYEVLGGVEAGTAAGAAQQAEIVVGVGVVGRGE